MKRLILTCGVVLLFMLPAVSQTTHTGWLATFYSVDFNKKSGLIGDVQFRSGDDFNHMQTLMLRAGYQYKLKPWMTATVGYALVQHRRTINGFSGYGPEHRIWEQLILLQKVKFINIQHRFRLEQRFISKSYEDDGSIRHDGNIYSNRFRYFFRSVIPFGGQKDFSRGAFGAVQDEVMLQFGDKSGTNGKVFDQNRLYLALGYRFSKKVDLEAGYMNQYVEGRQDNFVNNHVIQLATYLRF
ncbi:DUF2490 domain-containing protein [Flavihumibacter petaseus]|nr:DUF2490 domain-containing protein [Flavihumibacter petaseus]